MLIYRTTSSLRWKMLYGWTKSKHWNSASRDGRFQNTCSVNVIHNFVHKPIAEYKFLMADSIYMLHRSVHHLWSLSFQNASLLHCLVHPASCALNIPLIIQETDALVLQLWKLLLKGAVMASLTPFMTIFELSKPKTSTKSICCSFVAIFKQSEILLTCNVWQYRISIKPLVGSISRCARSLCLCFNGHPILWSKCIDTIRARKLHPYWR